MGIQVLVLVLDGIIQNFIVVYLILFPSKLHRTYNYIIFV